MSAYQFDGFSLNVSIYSDPDDFAHGDQSDVLFYVPFRDRPTSFADWYDFTSIIGKPLPTMECDYRAIALYVEFGTLDTFAMLQDRLLDLFESVLDACSWEDYFHNYFRESYQNELFDKFCLWDYVSIDRFRVYYHKQDINSFQAYSVIEQAFYGIPDVSLVIGDDYIPIECSDLTRDDVIQAIPKDIPNYNDICNTLLSELPYYVVAD